MAVEAFLAGRLTWIDIAAVIEAALDRHQEFPELLTSSHIIEADRQGREAANSVLGS
ncbi:MAG: hypothetical protein ACKPBG_12100 [Actinomycetota bacterium]